MRIRPDGIELLRAARVTLDTAIVPNLPDERRAAVVEIERAVSLAEDRLSQDATPSVAELAELEGARASMRGEVLAALPEERRYDARLVAKAIAVATRQLENGHETERREYERLAALLGAPPVATATPDEIRCTLFSLNERLGARIRMGEADVGTITYAATLAHLEANTHEALSESNPMHPRRPTAPEPPAPVDALTSESPSATHPEPGHPEPPAAAALAAWNDVPSVFMRAVRSGAAPAPLADRVDAWVHLNGAVGDAMCASTSAVLTAQADVFGWFAHRLAGNPRVPMVAVESAHQAHDVLVALAEASTEFCKLALAPFRRAESRQAEAARPL